MDQLINKKVLLTRSSKYSLCKGFITYYVRFTNSPKRNIRYAVIVVELGSSSIVARVSFDFWELFPTMLQGH